MESLPIIQNLPTLVRGGRKRLKLSQRELAKKVGIVKTYVAKIESGDKIPGTIVFLKLIKELGLEDQVWRGPDETV